MIHVLTPTGARPEAFAACAAQMRMQDYTRAVQWVIVDDGPSPMRTPEVGGWDVLHIRREPYWQVGQNTLDKNLLAGLAALPKGARVVVIEDDDQYAPWWLSRCDEWLDAHDLVGESHALYRSITSGAEKAMGNDRHASLCSTALKGPALDALRRSAEQDARGIDIRLWREFDGSKALYPPEPRGVVGVKCWPGRAGIGIGHRL